MSGSHRNFSGFSGKSLFFEEGCIYNRDGMVRVADFFRFWEHFSAIFAIAIYTPQGDGNLKATLVDDDKRIAIYTPQGDGNTAKASKSPLGIHCNLYPARGRKQETDGYSSVLRYCNLYPARGRKHRACRLSPPPYTIAIYTP